SRRAPTTRQGSGPRARYPCHPHTVHGSLRGRPDGGRLPRRHLVPRRRRVGRCRSSERSPDWRPTRKPPGRQHHAMRRRTMACPEREALRLGLMKVLGHEEEVERQHELAELGSAADKPGPLQSMCDARDLGSLKRFYDAGIAALEERVAGAQNDDPKLPYL